MPVDITRIKTSSEQSLRLVCSPLSWECDAVHALASQLAVDPYTCSNRVFPQLVECTEGDNGVAHINAVLTGVAGELQPGAITDALKSHSSRRGAATVASATRGVGLHDIASRGHWASAPSSSKTVFTYIDATAASDLLVAGVLAGWNDIDHDVIHPTLDDTADRITGVDLRETQKRFAVVLFETFITRLKTKRLVYSLAAVVILYYHDTSTAFPDHTLHSRMKTAVRVAIPELPDGEEGPVLLKWSLEMRKEFICANAVGLPPDVVQGKLTEDEKAASTVSINTFKGTLEKLLSTNQLILKSLQEVECAQSALGVRMGKLERSMEKLSLTKSPAPPKKASVQMPLKWSASREWPRALSSTKGVRLSDLLFQHFHVDLMSIPNDKQGSSQRECRRAIEIGLNHVQPDERPVPLESLKTDEQRSAWNENARALADRVAERVSSSLVASAAKTDEEGQPAKTPKLKVHVSAIVREYYRQNSKRDHKRKKGNNSS